MKIMRALGMALVVAGCATGGTGGGGADFWMDYGYYDSWYYGGGCCVDPPDLIGPPGPHPEHPIALPSDPKPSNPIASTPPPRPTAPVSRPMPAPRAAARGGGGRR